MLKDYKNLILITVFTLILTVYYINFNETLGIYCSDVYVYLLNALYFTGVNINSTQSIYLSPVICFLTSLLFNAGLEDKIAIFIVTGLFSLIGNIGLYLLLKTRFNDLLSLCGVVLYACFALNLTWFANGSLDIPAANITIWTVLLCIYSIKNNPRYYLILFPVFAVGFFTRYTVILIIPVLVLYYLYYKGFSIDRNELKYLAGGLLLAALVCCIILVPVLNMSNGEFGAAGQISGGISGNLGSSSDLAYNTDTKYYLSNFFNFISSSKISFENRTPVLESPTILSYIVFCLLGIGCSIYIREFEFNKSRIIAYILFITAILTFSKITSFITILLVFAALVLIGKNHRHKTGLVMFSWVLVYLIFFSYYDIKVNRYIIPAIAPLIYLILSSIEIINDKENLIAAALIVLFIMQAVILPFTFTPTDQFIAPEEMSNYITHEIDDYEQLNIGVYNTRPYHWYLGENITGIESNNLSKIEQSNIDYYISDVKINNLTEIKHIDNLYLYKKSV